MFMPIIYQLKKKITHQNGAFALKMKLYEQIIINHPGLALKHSFCCRMAKVCFKRGQWGAAETHFGQHKAENVL